MTELDRILSDFVDAWLAGLDPDVDAYLKRAPETQRGELADLIVTALEHAPDPPLEDAEREALRADPVVRGLVDAAAAEDGGLPALVLRLRKRAGLSVPEVARRTLYEGGVRRGYEKGRRYVERIEAGELEPRCLTRRALDALARTLDVSSKLLADAGPGKAAAAPVYRRQMVEPTTGDQLEVLADALLAPREDWDEIDEFFIGRE